MSYCELGVRWVGGLGVTFERVALSVIGAVAFEGPVGGWVGGWVGGLILSFWRKGWMG